MTAPRIAGSRTDQQSESTPLSQRHYPEGFRIPTADEGRAHAKIGPELYATWYPQMGGYVGKAVLHVWPDTTNNECFEAWVWHDGEFPFTEDAGPPAHLHHCMAEQFVDLGNFVLSLRVPQGDTRPEGAVVASPDTKEG